MTISRRWISLRDTLRNLAPGPAIAAGTALGLVLVLAASPNAANGQATRVFDQLRSPGEVGFVAAHRGDKAGAPENTLAAFGRAIASDAAFVEADIQLTADDVPVLMHDWTLDRTTNGTGPVWDITYAELSTLDAGAWFGEKFAGTRVPTLEQLLLLLLPSGKSAILELKGSWTTDQALMVSTLVDQYGMNDRVIMASFDLMTLVALREAAPDLPRVVITHETHGNPAVLADECGAIGIVISAKFVMANPDVVQRIHDAGLGVMIYTLNGEDDWASAVALGADGLITDKPTKLSAWLVGSASAGEQ